MRVTRKTTMAPAHLAMHPCNRANITACAVCCEACDKELSGEQ
jgi:hypothetical protein